MFTQTITQIMATLFSPTSPLPHIHLLLQSSTAAAAFRDAMTKYNLTITQLPHTIHECTLAELDDALTFQLVVSPANSYGILDGGFDHAISRAWSPTNDYLALTRAVQGQLYNSACRGFVVPGTCEIVRIPEEFRGKLRYGDGMGWGCKFIAICPTMRTPKLLVKAADAEVVYECVWSLLGKLERHNREAGENDRIHEILMTPLGTGAGGLSEKKWAEQMILGVKHHLEAVQNGSKWRKLTWKEAFEQTNEVAETHKM